MKTESKQASQAELATKKRVLVDVKIVIDPPNIYAGQTLEENARAFERWAKEFEAFVRDHRSQDPVSVSVEREYQNQCSMCGNDWEEDFCVEDGLWRCSGCGRLIEVDR